MSWFLLLLGSYLAGSLPFAYLVARARTGVDLRRAGSGNPGATNVFRVAGPLAALVVLVLDLGKGYLPAAVGRALDVPPWILGGMGLAAVLGHAFSVFLGFRGGKGVATATGFFAGVSLPAVALSLLVFVAVAAWKRYVSLGSMTAVASFPLVMFLASRAGWTQEVPGSLLICAVVTAALIVLFHTANIRRILAGTESKLGERLETGVR